MKIVDVICSPGRTGFYFDDQRAIKAGAGHDGVFYTGEPVTEGFQSVRQAGESISVMIVLEDGQVAYGDCAAVQYSGAGGRDPLFLAKDFIPIIDKYIKPELVGKEANDFRGLCKMMEAIQVEGKRLHTAIRYGVSQAILDAVAEKAALSKKDAEAAVTAALDAVAARDGAQQTPVLVSERNGRAVELELANVLRRPALALDTLQKLVELVERIGIAQRQHGITVLDGGELGGNVAADAGRRRIGVGELGMRGLQLLQLAHHAVEIEIRNLGRVFDVVLMIVEFELPAQLLDSSADHKNNG